MTTASNKISTALLQVEMKTIFAKEQWYFDGRMEGCDDGVTGQDVTTSKWKRQCKSRVQKSVWSDDLDWYIKHRDHSGDVGFIDLVWLDANPGVVANNCWERVYMTDVCEEFRMHFYTDPTDRHIVMWSLMAD